MNGNWLFWLFCPRRVRNRVSIKLGTIGGGVMGEALLSRLVAQRLYSPDEILVSDPSVQRREWLSQQYGLQVTDNNGLAASASDIVLLAVKPQVFAAVVRGLSEQGREKSSAIVSIMAGVTLSQLAEAFPQRPIIRAMPNTPATVAAGIAALAPGPYVQPHHLEQAKKIFQAVGEAIEVPENLMDAVTALSGSGPGYLAVAVEALIDGGVAVGLPRAIATKLALQTLHGTAQLLQETDLHPAQLKDRVTSPGGTTIAGIAALERCGFRSALIEAVRAAYARSRELGS